MNAMLGQLDTAAAQGQGRRDVSSLRVAISGGAVSPAALVHRIESELGLTYSISLAQTESSCSITMASATDSATDRAETLGRPLPNTEVRIGSAHRADHRVRRRRRDLHPGLPGNRGYLNAPEATAAAIDPDGWLHTGDLGSMDERGYLRIAGRRKDMIIRRRREHLPREIEEVLLDHPPWRGVGSRFPDGHYGEVWPRRVRDTGPGGGRR